MRKKPTAFMLCHGRGAEMGRGVDNRMRDYMVMVASLKAKSPCGKNEWSQCDNGGCATISTRREEEQFFPPPGTPFWLGWPRGWNALENGGKFYY